MSILLVIAMIVSLFTAVPFAFDAASAVAYLDRRWDSDTGKTVDSVLTQSWCIDIRDRSSNHLQSGAWYAVTTDTTISERLYIDSGTVHIILCDGATLTDRKGIGVSASATLAIYGQQNDTGKMYMHFDTNSYEMKGDYAVIGADSGDTGTINIYGGTLDLDSCYYSKGAVIGGGKGGAPYSVNIYGGNITCVSRESGAGIGGGSQGAVSYSATGGVHIYGGTVTVKSWSSGAGIGSGGKANQSNPINIQGGIIVSSGQSGAGIGAGIGGGDGGDGGTVTISDSTVDAYGGTDAAGIGGGEDGDGGHVEIYDSTVYAEGKSYGAGIGGGEDSSGDYCGIYGSSTVTAVSGGDGNAESIGHGDCG